MLTRLPSNAALESASTNLSGVKTDTYKTVGIHTVPRESYIRQQLDLCLSEVHQKDDVSVQGYQDTKQLNSYQRSTAFSNAKKQIISKFNLFDCHRFHKMGNWRTNASDESERYLMLKFKNEICGAIGFRIDIEQSKCSIDHLQVKDTYQKKHFGTILLHSAILVAALYKCEKIEVYSTLDSAKFYQGNGFVCQSLTYQVLDFSNEESAQKLLEKFKLTSSNFSLKKLIEKFSTNEASLKTPVL